MNIELEDRLRRLEASNAGAAREELQELDARLRQLESSSIVMINHVRTCERLAMEAAKERAGLRRELRAFTLTIVAAIAASYFGAHGIHAAFMP